MSATVPFVSSSTKLHNWSGCHDGALWQLYATSSAFSTRRAGDLCVGVHYEGLLSREAEGVLRVSAR